MTKLEQLLSRPRVPVLCFRHAGTHLIKPFVKRLIHEPILDVYKLLPPEYEPQYPGLVSFRDPRNILISQVRWTERKRGRDPVPGARSDRLIARTIAREGLDKLKGFARLWGDRPNMVRLDFEQITGPDREDHAARVAKFFGKTADEGRASLVQFLGTGQTFTGRHSDHRQWFGQLASAEWERQGGPALVRLMGYGDAD